MNLYTQCEQCETTNLWDLLEILHYSFLLIYTEMK